MSAANEPRQSKAERTAAAREKAREIREAQLKKDKRNKLLIGWGIVAAVVAIIVIVALVVTTNIKNNAPVAESGPDPGERQRPRRRHPAGQHRGGEDRPGHC